MAEALPIGLLAREGDGAHGAAVEGIPRRDEVGALGVAAVVVPAPHELDGGLDGLGARVAEKHPGQARPRGELRGEGHGLVGVEEVGDVYEALGLRREGARDGGVGVPEGAHRDARVQVEVLSTLAVKQPAPLAANHHDIGLLVVAQEVLAREAEGVFGAGHRRWSSTTAPRGAPTRPSWPASPLRGRGSWPGGWPRPWGRRAQGAAGACRPPSRRASRALRQRA
jgi:hypothetical protein